MKYGYLWWLYPYSKDEPPMAFGGSGFGGQILLIILEYDLLIVVNAWNLFDGPALPHRVVIDRALANAIERKQ
jgi:CubicO group peptidase (beta-lactamase class C family)